MNLSIDKRYSSLSLGILLHLIHNNEDFKNKWIEKYPNTKQYAENFFKDENCGCRPRIIQQYKADRFDADIFIVNYINENEGVIDWNEMESKAERDISGHVFSIPATESHYQDFLSSLHQKNATYEHFTSLVLKDKIILTFF
tara:strand:- start:20379 stop:20804 length:426 start_codon:yes stop_codon:yes gene_type:complete